MNSPSSNKVGPFPLLDWDDGAWTAEDVLPSWSGYQSRRGGYTSLSADVPSGGEFRLNVFSANGNAELPSMEQAAAYEYLKGHEADVHEAVLSAICSYYPGLRTRFLDSGLSRQLNERMPELQSPDQLKKLIGLGNVHVLSVAKEGHAYVGFEFGCSWDEEHGLGVMVHMARVIKVGGADTSFLEWIAERDCGSSPNE